MRVYLEMGCRVGMRRIILGQGRDGECSSDPDMFLFFFCQNDMIFFVFFTVAKIWHMAG